MYLYKKTPTPQNSAGKLTALLCLICGAALFILAGQFPIFFPSLIQLFGVILIGISIYIASAYLLKEYTFAVVQTSAEEDAGYAERFDFIITEKKYGKDIKVCHFSMKDINLVQTVTPNNKKIISKERQNMKRYTYNTLFAASRYIELRAHLDGDDFSIFIAYDDEFLCILTKFFEP